MKEIQSPVSRPFDTSPEFSWRTIDLWFRHIISRRIPFHFMQWEHGDKGRALFRPFLGNIGDGGSICTVPKRKAGCGLRIRQERKQMVRLLSRTLRLLNTLQGIPQVEWQLAVH